ncbi:hypothetical protein LYNGBM3L_31540 [Moorena producens 3L]|uniref:Resolvase/invertase-type recombinase catalytic domain-containing protein n=2 Tax=Coleofasciculaceae TaxID=1892251 RepID=F4XTZ9_9CYAN|nr:hypothetical protein LYNGBM3L_31540 [Moorena producens 3L]
MHSLYPEAEIIFDIGSGLNYKRFGLKTILERLMRGDQLTIIVACLDRLTRFGFELFEYLVRSYRKSSAAFIVGKLCSIG